MKRAMLISSAISLNLILATETRAEVLLAAFFDPSSGRGGVAQLDALSLQEFVNFPGKINGQGDTCWVENDGDGRLYTSTLNGNLDSFDAATGGHLDGIAQPDLQLGGMTLLGNDLLVAHTSRSTGMSNIQVFDQLTLQDKGQFLVENVDPTLCWLHLADDGVYGSSPEGTLWHFSTSGQILNSISEPGIEWSGLASAGGRLFAAYTNESGGSGGIRMFEPETLQDLGNLLTFPPGHQAGPFELRANNGSLYASFLDGSIDRYDLSGNLLASMNRPGIEWRGLTFATAAVPEPSSLLLTVAALPLIRRRRHASGVVKIGAASWTRLGEQGGLRQATSERRK